MTPKEQAKQKAEEHIKEMRKAIDTLDKLPDLPFPHEINIWNGRIDVTVYSKHDLETFEKCLKGWTNGNRRSWNERTYFEYTQEGYPILEIAIDTFKLLGELDHG